MKPAVMKKKIAYNYFVGQNLWLWLGDMHRILER